MFTLPWITGKRRISLALELSLSIEQKDCHQREKGLISSKRTSTRKTNISSLFSKLNLTDQKQESHYIHWFSIGQKVTENEEKRGRAPKMELDISHKAVFHRGQMIQIEKHKGEGCIPYPPILSEVCFLSVTHKTMNNVRKTRELIYSFFS